MARRYRVLIQVLSWPSGSGELRRPSPHRPPAAPGLGGDQGEGRRHRRRQHVVDQEELVPAQRRGEHGTARTAPAGAAPPRGSRRRRPPRRSRRSPSRRRRRKPIAAAAGRRPASPRPEWSFECWRFPEKTSTASTHGHDDHAGLEQGQRRGTRSRRPAVIAEPAISASAASCPSR